MPLEHLHSALAELLGEARLAQVALPGTALHLWLLDPANLDRPFSREETQRVLDTPPYWSFCWASGLALARFIAQHPHWVQGKRVLDFGAGSGVAAIAAARAGAACVVACDLDPIALAACRANAALNRVTLEYRDNAFSPRSSFDLDSFDLILAADVLYDRENLPLLAAFLERAPQALVADSRIRDLSHPCYTQLAHLQAMTLPDLAEPEAFRQVSLYHGQRP